MRCPYCHQEHPAVTKYCPVTGTALPPSNMDQASIGKGFETRSGSTGNQLLIKPPVPFLTIAAGIAGLVFLIAAYLVYSGTLKIDLGQRLSNKSETTTQSAILSTELTGIQNKIPSSTPRLITGITNPTNTPSFVIIPNQESPTTTPIDIASHTPSLSPTSTQTLTSTPEKVKVAQDNWIVYTYGEDEKRNIYLIQPWTGEKKQLTANAYNDESPTYRESTQQLIYSSYRSDGWELYLLDLQRMQETQLTTFNGQARHPEWSPVPGSTQVIFEGRSNTSSGLVSNVWMLDVVSKELKQLTYSNADSRPQWSPDGKKIVFGRALMDNSGDGRITTADFLSIFILDLETEEITQVTFNNAGDNFQYSWSPDSEWILYCSARRDANGDGFINLDDSRNLWLVKPNGEDEHELVVNNLSTFSPNWSPSGRYIVFTAHRSSGDEIWIYEVESGDLQRITAAGSNYHTEWALP